MLGLKSYRSKQFQVEKSQKKVVDLIEHYNFYIKSRFILYCTW
jgi:hypothetical protein